MAIPGGERIVLRRGFILPFLKPTFPPPPNALYFPKYPSSSSLYSRNAPLIVTHAKKKNKKSSPGQPVLKQTTVEEEEEEVEAAEEFEEIEEDYDEQIEAEAGAEEYIEDSGDEFLLDDDEDFEDDFEVDEANLYVGDGGGGGGISLAGTWWDKEALTMAEEVLMSFDGDLKIYAFKTSANSKISMRIEKLSSKYGSPSMKDIEIFSSAYRLRLDEAVLAEKIPENISLEVSSPGVERVVRIPDELERFKEKPMYVRYVIDGAAEASNQESDGVFRLVSFDLETCHCTWAIADVKVNRNQAGKGRPLNKKQREWRLETPFDSLRLVRLHSDC
ncbi:uncharacterized protein M6B38_172815 [Iris pallida]|uniref:DUF7912 domain-containing protein n=1 Tax=Iris pallida TaxID=29817 RepID=A0AAX6ETP1_IRIPA|nr:uncharacterized protein M6B38_172815 [Iris pallida]